MSIEDDDTVVIPSLDFDEEEPTVRLAPPALARPDRVTRKLVAQCRLVALAGPVTIVLEPTGTP